MQWPRHRYTSRRGRGASWPARVLVWWKAKQSSQAKARVLDDAREGYAVGSKLDWREVTRARVGQMSGVKIRSLRKPLPRYSRWIVLLVMIATAYVIFGTRIFILDTLEIKGQHLVRRDEIEAVVFPSGFKSINAVTYGEGRARRKLLAAIPQIREVEFEKNLVSKTITIQIKENDTAVIWVTDGKKYLVNRLGVVYQEAPENSPLLPVEDLKNVPVGLNQQIVSPEFIEFVSGFVANLPRRTNVAVRRITVPETTFEIEVETDEGWKIILDTTASYEDQLNNLVRILRELPTDLPIQEYVDLRIGKKVFYR